MTDKFRKVSMKLFRSLSSGIIIEKLKKYFQSFKEIIFSPFRLIKSIIFVLGSITLALLVLFGLVSYLFFTSLPDAREYNFNSLKKEVIKNNLSKSNSKYRWISLDKINRDLIYAIVFSEDTTFFEHQGINYQAIIDSFAKNLKDGAYTRGASTISQQVAKNIFLTQEKTINRKLKEIFITKDLEKNLTKNQILELYLNLAEFGPEIYGVYSAGRVYFDKNPSQINAVEGAFLAIFLPSPKKFYYSIVQNKFITKKQIRKIQNVIKTFRYKEMIGPDKYKEYMSLKGIDRYLSANQ